MIIQNTELSLKALLNKDFHDIESLLNDQPTFCTKNIWQAIITLISSHLFQYFRGFLTMSLLSR